MKNQEKKWISACVTVHRQKVRGGIPIFYADDDQEMKSIASLLADVVNGVPHDLGNGVYIVVQH